MRRAILLSLLVISSLIGCNNGQEAVKWPTRPKTYTSMVSLSPSTTELAMSYAYTVKLVGRTASCNYPVSVTSVPVVAQVKPDYEKIKAANPGLIVLDSSIYNAQDLQQIDALGIDTFEFKSDTVEGFTKELSQLGALLGTESEISGYVDKIYNEIGTAKSQPFPNPPTVAIIMPGANGQHMIAGVKSFAADVVNIAGGKAVGPDSDRFVPIDAERLVQLNPDMIITAGKPDPLMQDARLKSIKTIATGSVRGLEQDIVIRRGSRVDKDIKQTHIALVNMAQEKTK